MSHIWRVLLVFLVVLLELATTSSAHGNLTLRCHPNQASTLLQLKKSFNEVTGLRGTSLPATIFPSWQGGTDWEGVSCGDSSGRVMGLNLSGLKLAELWP
jgi:hypothetical protein